MDIAFFTFPPLCKSKTSIITDGFGSKLKPECSTDSCNIRLHGLPLNLGTVGYLIVEYRDNPTLDLLPPPGKSSSFTAQMKNTRRLYSLINKPVSSFVSLSSTIYRTKGRKRFNCVRKSKPVSS